MEINMPETLTERQREVVVAYCTSDFSELNTARCLGVDVKTVRSHLWLAAKKGMAFTPDTSSVVAPAGWECVFSTVYHDGEGNVKGQWDRVKPMAMEADKLFAFIKSRVPVSLAQFESVKGFDPEIQLEITLADLHYGMLAWDKETGGGNYDLKITRKLVIDSINEVYARAGRVAETVLVLMGDNFHSDFFSNRTEGHGHSLDTDGRYPLMIHTGAETFITAIELCKQFSDKVQVKVLYGNHDKQSSINLQTVLYFHFLDRPGAENITIDLSPSKHRYNIWGVSATEYTHGDGTNKYRLSSDIMQYVAQHDITGVREFYAKQAHLHKEHIEDVNGVTFEIVPSPTAKDAYAAGAHYSSKRALVATKYHKRKGELDRFKITPRSLEVMKESIH